MHSVDPLGLHFRRREYRLTGSDRAVPAQGYFSARGKYKADRVHQAPSSSEDSGSRESTLTTGWFRFAANLAEVVV